jgi:hypothetical protein
VVVFVRNNKVGWEYVGWLTITENIGFSFNDGFPPQTRLLASL